MLVNEIEKAIRVYLENSIITRKELFAIDSFPRAKELAKALDSFLEEKEIENNSYCMQVWNDKKTDYSNVIFNLKEYSIKEAKKYMINYVLDK